LSYYYRCSIYTSSCYYLRPVILFPRSDDHRDLHSFPTRRSSDLPISTSSTAVVSQPAIGREWPRAAMVSSICAPKPAPTTRISTDRKSTRLNSSHVSISYAVFCLKKKKQEDITKV